VDDEPEPREAVADPDERHSLVRPATTLPDGHLLIEAPEEAECLVDSVRIQEPESRQLPDARSAVVQYRLRAVLFGQQLQ
jgi:hypothetical protein